MHNSCQVISLFVCYHQLEQVWSVEHCICIKSTEAPAAVFWKFSRTYYKKFTTFRLFIVCQTCYLFVCIMYLCWIHTTLLEHQRRIDHYQFVKNWSSERWMLFRCRNTKIADHINIPLFTFTSWRTRGQHFRESINIQPGWKTTDIINIYEKQGSLLLWWVWQKLAVW
jgi:hypothetical protein